MRILVISVLFIVCCCHNCLGAGVTGEIQTDDNGAAGQRSITFYDGSVYVGQIKDGMPEGQGTITFADGSRYTGEFRGGEMNGQGTMTFPDGSKYMGDFKDGALFGRGILTFPDHSQYEGQFQDDQYHGDGLWTSPAGINYEGQFKYGNFDGKGVYLLPDGSRVMGFFKGDRLVGRGAVADQGTIPSQSRSTQSTHMNVNTEKEAEFSRELAGTYEDGDLPDDPTAGLEKKELSASNAGDGKEAKRTQNEAPVLVDPYAGDKGDPAVSQRMLYSVQVGAFVLRKNAEKLAGLLKEKGYNARLVSLTDYGNKPWFAVRLGDYSSFEEAREKAGSFSEKEKMTATVRPVDSL